MIETRTGRRHGVTDRKLTKLQSDFAALADVPGVIVVSSKIGAPAIMGAARANE